MKIIETMKDRQAENYLFEQQKLEMWQETLLKKIEDKHMLAKVGVEAELKKRKEMIAKIEENRAKYKRSGAMNNMEGNFHNDTLDLYLTEIKSAQLSPKSENFENTADSPAQKSHISKQNEKYFTVQKPLNRIKDYDIRKEIFAKREFNRKLRHIRLLQQGLDEKLQHASQTVAKYQ